MSVGGLESGRGKGHLVAKRTFFISVIDTYINQLQDTNPNQVFLALELKKPWNVLLGVGILFN